MSEAQRVIKYLAIAFALFLIFGIMSSIMGGIIMASSLFYNNDEKIAEKYDTLKQLEIGNNIYTMDIDVKSVKLTFKRGDILKAETDNKYINVNETDDRLYIIEKDHSWFKNSNSELIIYIPEDLVFNDVSIESGAGQMNIEELSTKNLHLELGVGSVNINNLYVTDNASIEGGAGKININQGTINNLGIDMGVGKLELTSALLGNNKINSGVGTVDINLIGEADDYKIHINDCLGSFIIDDNKMDNDSTYGIGNNFIDIDGGIGTININFTK